ncbi:hypothetical protein QYM36_009064 [Artemia franciscana]|uniref:Uncharacterized protein n=1 Tax=Artemia franciscana TaxID=6661 RepID=A0AA88HVH1_ARTSF|nr:hypothetical protein QYM36_009064 [Artemia franciscana]
MVTDNLELSDNYSESKMSESSGVQLLPSDLKGSKKNILRYNKSNTHIDRCKEAGAAYTPSVLMSVRQKDIDVTNAEIRLSAWFASEDTPTIKGNTLIPVLNASAPDSAVLKSAQMKRTKITGIVMNVHAPYEMSRLSHDLSKTFYSLVADKTTDRGTVKSLGIIVQVHTPRYSSNQR